ncbi:MAG: hypothetical protein CMA63_05785 [Euryarchaeota archaeon]|nr:hypothetical protein [Euryarchaeota archaeon]|tara:strand:+ start:21825 stop:22247 length:423 start_codon:yes stop_codon:yes gene_type:complete
MGRIHEWRGFAFIGVVLVAQAFVDFAPAGPWDSRSFSRGMIGLVGLACLYLAWFRFTFDQKGVAPTINLWSNPKETWLNVVLVGLGLLMAIKIAVWQQWSDVLPEPATMILAVIGLLIVLNGLYVGIITVGVLAPSSEEE